MSGGLSRHTTLLKKQREKNSNLIYIDNGGLFAASSEDDQEVLARVGLHIDSSNGLDAMNLGPREFYFGPQYLADRAKKISFPFISTNISSKVEMPWLKKYIIKKVGKQKVAILGILPENAFSSNFITIESPAKAVKKTISQIKNKANIFILLSQLNAEETANIVKEIPEINLAVAHSEEELCKMTDNSSQIIVPNSVSGKFFLSADIAVDGKGKVKVSQNTPVLLDDSIEHVPTVDAMIMTSLQEAQEQRISAYREVGEHLKQPGTTALKPLSQEEFFAAVNKKKAELKALRPEEGEEVKAKLFLDGQEIPATIRKVPRKTEDTEKNQPVESKEIAQ